MESCSHRCTLHLETLPKGYSLSRPSCSVQEGILHRSAHLLPVSAFFLYKRGYAALSISLSPPPEGVLTGGGIDAPLQQTPACRFSNQASGTRQKGKNKETSRPTLRNLWHPLWRWVILLLPETLGTTTDWPRPLVEQCSKVSRAAPQRQMCPTLWV